MSAGVFQRKFLKMPFDGQARIAGQQNFGRLGRFLGSSQIAPAPPPAPRAPEDDWDSRYRASRAQDSDSVILSEQIVAERVQGRPLISGVAVAALHGR